MVIHLNWDLEILNIDEFLTIFLSRTDLGDIIKTDDRASTTFIVVYVSWLKQQNNNS